MPLLPILDPDRAFYSITYSFSRALNETYPEHYLREITGTVLAHQLPKEDSKEETAREEIDVEIGSFIAYMVLLEEAQDEAGHSAFEILDSVSMMGYYETLFNGEWFDDVNPQVDKQFDLDTGIPRLFILHSVAIAPEYRGRNLGLFVASEIIREFGRGCELILLSPYPQQYSPVAQILATIENGQLVEPHPQALQEGKARLAAYWSALGFENVSNSDLLAMTFAGFRPYQDNSKSNL